MFFKENRGHFAPERDYLQNSCGRFQKLWGYWDNSLRSKSFLWPPPLPLFRVRIRVRVRDGGGTLKTLSRLPYIPPSRVCWHFSVTGWVHKEVFQLSASQNHVLLVGTRFSWFMIWGKLILWSFQILKFLFLWFCEDPHPFTHTSSCNVQNSPRPSPADSCQASTMLQQRCWDVVAT